MDCKPPSSTSGQVPPPPVKPPLCTQPGLTRDLIASHLHSKEMQRLMASHPYLLEDYGMKMKRLRLQQPKDWYASPLFVRESYTTIISSLLSRCPDVEEVCAMDHWSITGLAQAMQCGLCTKLEALDLVLYNKDDYQRERMRYNVKQFRQQGQGMIGQILWMWRYLSGCWRPDRPILDLALAIESSRTASIKVLRIRSQCINTISIGPLLDLPILDSLAELHLEIDHVKCDATANVVAWLQSTHAPHLLVLTGISSHHVANALTSSNEHIAPHLQILGLKHEYDTIIMAIHRGAWPDLQQLTMELDFNSQFAFKLMEAVGRGARGLRSLKVVVKSYISDVMLAVVNALYQNWCPGLEELDLRVREGTPKDPYMAFRLAKALKTSNHSIKKLRLMGCGMDGEGLFYLCWAFINGACPDLEVVDLSHNQQLQGKALKHIVWMMDHEVPGGKIVLPALRELKLDAVIMGDRVREDLCRVCHKRSLQPPIECCVWST